MEKETVLLALKKMRDSSKQRKFEQSVELAINFTGIDFKKAENRIDAYVQLPYSTGKSEASVCLFARDKNFASEAKPKLARVIMESEIEKMDKKSANALAEEFDSFIAEGPVMLTVGKFLGQILAPKGKMPKPIQPELSALEQALKGIKSGTRVSNKKGKYMPVVHAMIGREKMKDEELAENFLAVYNAVFAELPRKEQNIKSSYVKLSMGPSIKVVLQKGEKK